MAGLAQRVIIGGKASRRARCHRISAHAVFVTFNRSPKRVVPTSVALASFAALVAIVLLGIAPSASAVTYEQAVEGTPDVAHFWPMGESSGTSFEDTIGGANAELAGGVTLGEPGGLVEDPLTSAAFNGTSGTAHAEVNLSGTHKLTIEFWMKWHAYAADSRLALEFTPNFTEHPGGFII
jgi:hypothetical protein